MERISRTACIISIYVILMPAPSVLAWWEKGHRIIAANAVAVLPDDMPDFFKKGEATLVRLSVQPDMWKEFGNELRRAESPDHYLDTEYLAPIPAGVKFHRDRYLAMRNMYKQGLDPARVGMLPYRIMEDFQKLRGVFAQYRKNPEDLSIQQEVLFYAGILSHYAGDTAQPLHMTIHFNGRVNNEGRVIKGDGIHARFEGEFVRDFVESADCKPHVRAPVLYLEMQDAIRQAFTTSFTEVDRVYQLDESGQLKKPNKETLTFGRQCLAHGSSFVASLWYTAWVTSEKVELPDR